MFGCVSIVVSLLVSDHKTGQPIPSFFFQLLVNFSSLVWEKMLVLIYCTSLKDQIDTAEAELPRC